MVDKKVLIDLFESQLNSDNLPKISEKYYKGIECPSIRFSSDLERFDFLKTTYDDCEMFLYVNKNEEFFLFFNSLSSKITFLEFKRLKTLINKKHKLFLSKANRHQQQKDKKLLNTVFSNKNIKESRKTLVEKSNKEIKNEVSNKLKNA